MNKNPTFGNPVRSSRVDRELDTVSGRSLLCDFFNCFIHVISINLCDKRFA